MSVEAEVCFSPFHHFSFFVPSVIPMYFTRKWCSACLMLHFNVINAQHFWHTRCSVKYMPVSSLTPQHLRTLRLRFRNLVSLRPLEDSSEQLPIPNSSLFMNVVLCKSVTLKVFLGMDSRKEHTYSIQKSAYGIWGLNVSLELFSK